MNSYFPLLETEDDPERDLAYWLESADPSNPIVLKVLYERYALDVQRLAAWLLADGERVDRDEVKRVLQYTFLRARARLASFRGQASVRAWITGLALERVRVEKGWRVWKKLWRQPVGSALAVQPPETASQAQRWWRVAQLPEPIRNSLLVRYAANLKPATMGSLLKGDEQRQHAALNQARRLLLNDRSGTPEPGKSDAPHHPEILAQFLAGLDDLHTPAFTTGQAIPVAWEVLETHLKTCPACQQVVTPFQELHEALPVDLAARWQLDDLSPFEQLLSREDLSRLDEAGGPGFANNSSAPGVWRTAATRASSSLVWEVLLMTGMLLLVLAFGWNMSRQDTHRGRPLYRPTPGPVPTAMVLPAGRTLNDPSMEESQTEQERPMIFTWQPSLSADGKWIVYSRLTQQIINGLVDVKADVLLLDLETRQNRVIATQGESAFGWYSFYPALSADGHMVAFDSNSRNLIPASPYTCPPQDGQELADCNDIYVYDVRQDTIRLVSRALDEGRGNWSSLLPALSADGRFVAFWSAATNLLPAPSLACAQVDPSSHCWDVYVRDLQSGTLRRAPVGRLDHEGRLPDLEQLSISQDGRWLGVTIAQVDAMGPRLEQFFSTEAYLYDLVDQEYLPLNRTPDGKNGNGASKLASLTPDGRFVAFASLADNLVEADGNAQADVFLWDRQSGLIELISQSSDGRQGDNPSGAFMTSVGVWGERLSISADGRRVAFLSTAANLTEVPGSYCSATGWFPCAFGFIRDRARRQTIALAPPLNAIYLFPTLSADGLHASLVHYDLECPRSPYCAVILNYDLEKRELTQATTGEVFETGPRVSGWADVRLLQEADKRVSSMAFAPHSTLLAAGMDDGRLVLWQVDTGLPVKRIEGDKLQVSSLAFSPDGALLAVGWRDNHVALYRMPAMELLVDLPGEGGTILNLAFSPDGTMLAVGSAGAAWTWEINPVTYAVLDYQDYPGLQVRRVAFSPDGDLLVHGLNDGSLWLRSAESGELVMRLAAHLKDQAVTALAFSSDGVYLTDGGAEGLVNVWKLQKRRSDWQVEHLLGIDHKDWISDLAFPPMNDTLFVATLLNGLRLWKIPQAELLAGPVGTRWDAAVAIVFSSDGQYMALNSGWGGIKIWQRLP